MIIELISTLTGLVSGTVPNSLKEWVYLVSTVVK